LTNIAPIPGWLSCIIDKLDQEKITEKRCNHFLINEYKGAIGIMPHTDGPLYHPYVSIVSLGCPILFKFFADIDAFYSEDAEEVLLVEDGSLFIFEKDMYHKRLHSINEIAFESFAVDLALVQNPQDSKWSIEAAKSKIVNFKNTSLYLNHIAPKFAELAGFNSKDMAIECLMKELNTKHHVCYTFDIASSRKPGEDEDTLMLIVGWARDLRVSLTVRYVKLSES
jgi:2OG-Fe(II) oxygenase superfamily